MSEWRERTLEEFEELVEDGKLPVFIQTDRHIGIFVVEPYENSRLQSDDGVERGVAVVRAMVLCGTRLDADGVG